MVTSEPVRPRARVMIAIALTLTRGAPVGVPARRYSAGPPVDRAYPGGPIPAGLSLRAYPCGPIPAGLSWQAQSRGPARRTLPAGWRPSARLLWNRGGVNPQERKRQAGRQSYGG